MVVGRGKVITAELGKRLIAVEGARSSAGGASASSGVGLSHALMAANVQDGGSVSLLQRGNRVDYDVEFIVTTHDKSPSPLQTRLRKRPTAAASATATATAKTAVAGAAASTAEPATLPASAAPAPALPPGLRYVVVDDSQMRLKWFDRMAFKKVLKAGPGSCTLGATLAEAHGAVARIVELGADVVILDQNIEFKGVGTVLGSDLCRELRDKHNFRGVVCISSGNSTDADIELYLASGADCVSPKGVVKEDLVETLARAMHDTRERRLQGGADVKAAPPARAAPAPSALPPGLRYVVVDDSKMRLKWFARMAFKKLLKAGPGSCTLGATLVEAHGAVARIVELGADVVILDQNIDFKEEGTVLGSDLCRELRDKHDFKGVVCISSGNSRHEDIELYLASGADCVSPKGVGNEELVETLAQAVHDTRERRLQGGAAVKAAPAQKQ